MVEESADTIYLVLPPVSPVGQGVEISDEQLEAVAGGDSGHLTCNWTMHCTDSNGYEHPC